MQIIKKNNAIKGVSNYAKTIKPSKRGELEITDLNKIYLNENRLSAILLNSGYGWFDTGTIKSLLDASNFVGTIQEHQNIIICSPEEIGYKNGWLSKEKLLKQAEVMKKNEYGKHLCKVAKEIIRK